VLTRELNPIRCFALEQGSVGAVQAVSGVDVNVRYRNGNQALVRASS